MKQLIRVLAISAVSLVWVAAASADTIINSAGNNGATGAGFVTYVSGPVSYCGTSACTNGAFTSSTGTYNLGPSVSPWSPALAGSNWVSFDPNTAPGGTHAQGDPNPNVPNTTGASSMYVYSETFNLAAGNYLVNFSVLADDTTSVFLSGANNSPVIVPGSGMATHCVNNPGPTCTMTFTLDNYAYTSSGGMQTLTFDVQQLFGIASGLDFSIDFAPVVPTPEPSSLLLLGTGLLGAAGALRRRLRA